MKEKLLVIDLQKEFIRKNIEEYNKILKYIKNDSDKYDEVIATKFINTDGSQFEGNWIIKNRAEMLFFLLKSQVICSI